MNRTILALATTIALSFTAVTAAADEAKPAAEAGPRIELREAPKFTFDVELATTMPVGALADGAAMQMGAMVGGNYTVLPKLSVGVRGGYLAGLTKYGSVAGFDTSTKLNVIPVLAGARYFITGDIAQRQGFFVAAEAGAFFASSTTRISDPQGRVSDVEGTASDTHIGGTLGLGYRAWGADIQAGMVTMDLAHADASSAFLATLGFSFFTL